MSNDLPAQLTAPQLTRYWLHIPSINRYDYIDAASLTEAKVEAAKRYLQHWSDLRWISGVA